MINTGATENAEASDCGRPTAGQRGEPNGRSQVLVVRCEALVIARCARLVAARGALGCSHRFD